jgi:hypothetical protein
MANHITTVRQSMSHSQPALVRNNTTFIYGILYLRFLSAILWLEEAIRICNHDVGEPENPSRPPERDS